MKALNIEIKARCADTEKIKAILEAKNARFIGTDHQVDTYFNTKKGRMKLREGNIENALIHYNRPDQEGPKRSKVILYKSTPGSSLKTLLSEALGVTVVVNKQRSIYFIDNVKFHLDVVKHLGTFAEIEAIDTDGSTGRDQLQKQCEYYIALFGIKQADLVENSYSDMILKIRDAR